jgi:hypothetical protein
MMFANLIIHFLGCPTPGFTDTIERSSIVYGAIPCWNLLSFSWQYPSSLSTWKYMVQIENGASVC